jgi:phage regulator Rha-like protein
MNELTIINHDGVDVVESTLVAKAIDKQHGTYSATSQGVQPSAQNHGKLAFISDFFNGQIHMYVSYFFLA